MAGFSALSMHRLQHHIRTVAKETERVVLTTHARKRMKERNVLDAEVYECLRKGSVRRTPEPDIKTGNLICRMEWYGASRNLQVCVALDEDFPDLVVVTVIVN